MNPNESLILRPAINREITKSRKWLDVPNPDVLGMGLADMDFQTAPPVIEAIKLRVEHGIFGYDQLPDFLFETIIKRLELLHNWKVKPEWILLTPGIIPSLYATNRAIGSSHDDVITLVPTYGEIMNSALRANQNLIQVEMNFDGKNWAIDFDKFEESITPKTKVLNFCNPHNPIGHVYNVQELTKIAEICKRHNIVISSDEVYADLILDENKRHIPIASIDDQIAQNTITHLSASKTFNLSGLRFSYTIIPNEGLREKFIQNTSRILPGVNFLGAIATLAAYQYGEEWRGELINYLRINRDLIYQYFDPIPNVSVSKIEGTFLAWIDIRSLGLNNPTDFFATHAKVQLLDGNDFSAPGFIRLNFGCETSKLEQALIKIKQAILTHQERIH